jgi:Phage tail lysozyme
MAGVTPRQIYQALTGAGASTTQAIGIMANGIAESGLNPEAIGDQGTSFGTWQQHGAGYAGLVTGNPQADLAAQVKVVAQNGGFAAATGSNAGEAAGNFAANYERCTTCQPGQASYNARVANAATVAGWVSSGKWPASAGSASSAGGSSSAGGATSTATSATSADCAWGFSGLGGGVGPVQLPQLNICLIKKSTLRHAAGGALMTAGGTVAMFGVILLAAFAFRASGAARTAAQVAGTFTPAGRVYERAATRQRATQARTARATRTETARGSREARRAAGTPANQSRAVRGQAPRRPPPPRPPRPPREEHH